MRLADTLKNSILAVKTARAERARLEERLCDDKNEAADALQTALREAGLPRAQVEALISDPSKRNSTTYASGGDAADGRAIHFVVAIGRPPVSAYENGHELLVVRWSSVQEPDDENEAGASAGWAATDKTWERHDTAVQAVNAALTRPDTAQRVAELLIKLGA